MSDTSNPNLIEQIVAAYGDMTGDVPPERDGQSRFHASHDRWERLSTAQQLDPSDMLFLMLLDNHANDWAGRTMASVASFVGNSSSFMKHVDKMRRFMDLMDDAEMTSTRESLLNRVKQAISHYGAGEREDVAKLTSSIRDIPELWMSAMTCLNKTLKIHQFRQGEPDGAAPLYQKDVLGFFSVNDAMRIGMSMPSGISMCMIRDADAVHSYFCFLVRNGGTLSIVTDQMDYSHPLQKYRSRRPERHLDRRMGQSLFPYSLLDVQYVTDDEGYLVGSFVPKLDGIIPHQAAAYRMKKIADLEPAEIVWAAFMFGLIEKKFFRENHRTEKRSYTGEMIDLPLILEAQAETYGLPMVVGQTETLQAVALSSTDLSAGTIADTARLRRKRTGHADWMEDRYGPKVDGALLNRVAAPGMGSQALLLGDVADGIYATKWSNPATEKIGSIHALDATTFGTAEEILADRVWIARHNQAMEIKRLAHREYIERKAEIQAWWTEAVTGRKNALVAVCQDGSLQVHSQTYVGDFGHNSHSGPRGAIDILSFDALSKSKGSLKAYADHAVAFGDAVYKKSPATGRMLFQDRRRCCITGRPADVVATITPKLADDLAAILGIEKTDLPDVLQHWRQRAPYIGNSILDRLDPLETVNDPWSEMPFLVKLYFSSTGTGVKRPEETSD